MIKNLLVRSVIILISAFFVLSLGSCISANAAEFSADMLSNNVIKGKIYVKGENFRQEIKTPGGNQVMIFRNDKGLVWTLMPQNRMYLEMSGTAMGDINPRVVQKEIEKTAKKEHLGKENVNGYTCEKYKFIFRDKSKGSTIQWLSKKLKFPVKMEINSPDGQVVIEYKNIKETKLSDSLFKVPSGYRKMTMPAGMLGM